MVLNRNGGNVVVNHIYDADRDRTLCGDYAGRLAESVSGERYSCPECLSVTQRVVHREVVPK